MAVAAALGALQSLGSLGGGSGAASADQLLADTTSGGGGISIAFAPFPNQGAPSTPVSFDTSATFLPQNDQQKTLLIGAGLLLLAAVALKMKGGR